MSQSAVQFRRVPLPWEEPDNRDYLAVVMDNVFTESECQALIQRSEAAGYEQALVNVGGGRQVKMTDYRNSDRCILDDPVQAEEIWQRILTACEKLSDEQRRELRLEKLFQISVQSKRKSPRRPPTVWHAVGLNERLRFLRYGSGNFFSPHGDGCFIRGNEAGVDRAQERSFVTCQVYLNEDFTGGATRFLSDYSEKEESYSVVPKTGSVLLFDHPLYHEGCPVESGRKYAIRTDVMYTRKGPGREYSKQPIVLKKNDAKTASDSFDESMDTV